MKLPETDMPIFSLARCAALLLCLYLPAWGAAAAEPAAIVNEFDSSLLDAMKNARALGPKGRFDRLGPAMEQHFDLAAMTRDVTGAQWSHLTDEQKNKLISAFTRFQVAIFADWFDSYAGQSFQVRDVVTRNDDIATVGVLISASPLPMRLEYVLRASSPGVWRIVDVRYEGWVSTVERRRSEFVELFERYGYDGLLARLEAKGNELLDHADNPASPHLQTPLRDLLSIPMAPVW